MAAQRISLPAVQRQGSHILLGGASVDPEMEPLRRVDMASKKPGDRVAAVRAFWRTRSGDALVGITISVVGIVYMALIGTRLLGRGQSDGELKTLNFPEVLKKQNIIPAFSSPQ